MTKDEINKFAAGTGSDNYDSSDTLANSIDQEKFVLNNEIEAFCPDFAYKKRAKISYPEYRHDTYFSTFCNLERGFTILLPKNYSEEKKYPVLYMLHGIFGDEYSFSGDDTNGVRTIVTNLANDGIIDETIVVCPNMFATKDPEFKPGFSAKQVIPYDEFIYDLTNDLMPFIEENYSVLKGRDNTYLAGFSMGGRETLFINLKRPELFGYVCAISSAPGLTPTSDNFMSHVGQLSEEEFKYADNVVTPTILIDCCGTSDSVVGTFPQSYHELMVKNNVPHIWYEIPGVDHNSEAVRSGLYNLFKQIAFDKSNK